MNEQKALKKAIKSIGKSYADLALLYQSAGHKKINSSRISTWVNRDKKCPADMVLSTVKICGGVVSAHELRPDIYPREAKAS